MFRSRIASFDKQIAEISFWGEFAPNDELKDITKTLFQARIGSPRPRSGQQRLRPIISTTATTIGGLIVLTVSDEVWQGLGVVIIFGIAFATVLTLVVVPVMYSLFEGLGAQVLSAFRGPHWLEAPQGRSFFFSRRRWARTKGALIALAQAAVLIVGVVLLWPRLVTMCRDVVIQTPGFLSLAIETSVFYLGLLLEGGAVLFLLMSPTWLGLLYLMNLRSAEGYYVEITPEGMMVTSPLEKFFLPAADINKVSYSRLTGALNIRAGWRIIRVRRVIEDKHAPAKQPLRTWLAGPGPSRSKVREGAAALKEAVEGLIQRGKTA